MNGHKKTFLVALAVVSLSACSAQLPFNLDGTPRKETGNLMKPLPLVPPPGKDGGVVVAETEVAPVATGLGADLSTPDCDGPAGYGITVGSTKGDKKYLFNPDGQPCEKADEIFNGRNKVHQRAPSQAVTIGFIDRKGPLPGPEQEVLDMTVPAGYAPEHPEEYAITAGQMAAEVPQTDPSGDALEETVREWEGQAERDRLMGETERLLADLRSVQRLSNNQSTEVYKDRIEELLAQLRAAQKREKVYQHRHEALLSQLQSTREVADAERVAEEQRYSDMKREMENLSHQMQRLQNMNLELEQEKREKEKIYQKKIASLSGNLRVAETEANRARQQIVLEAAKKIAEAERLAYAARIAQKQAMEREAQRLQQEADSLLYRASDLGEGRAIVLPGMEGVPDIIGAHRGKQAQAQANAASPELPVLEALPVTLHETDKTLEEIFKKAFADMEPKIGKWRVVWELSDKNMGIPLEKWTVAAEARFDDFLAYVVKQVAEGWDVQLKFSHFDRSRLFVISDQ